MSLDSKQPKWHHGWKRSPENRLLCNSRVLVFWLEGINSYIHFAPSRTETTWELCCLACHELLAPLDTHALQHWLTPLADALSGAESQHCSVSAYTLFLLLCISPLSPSAPALTHSDFSVLPWLGIRSSLTNMLWQDSLTVFAFFSSLGKPPALTWVEGFSISHRYLKKIIDAEAFKKSWSCYTKPVTKMLPAFLAFYLLQPKGESGLVCLICNEIQIVGCVVWPRKVWLTQETEGDQIDGWGE